VFSAVSHDKKKKRNQNRPHNQRAAGLVNANHFYETAEELANRHLQQHRQQQKRQAQEQGQRRSSQQVQPVNEKPNPESQEQQ
jgi:hypothetical protein